MEYKKLFVFFSFIVPVFAFTQKIQLKPSAGLNFCLNYNPKKEQFNLAIPTMQFKTQRWVPDVSFDVAYTARKHWGVSAGVVYRRNISMITGNPVDGFTPEFVFYDYNLWFPLKVLYELPLNSGERSITFSTGSVIGYNRFVPELTKNSLTSPYQIPATFNYYSFPSYEPFGHTKYLQAGVTAGIELHPFRQFNGLVIAADYSISFMRTAKRFAGVYELHNNTDYYAIQHLTVAPRQQYLSLRLSYNFSIGKRVAETRWKFLNTNHQPDTAYYSLKLRHKKVVAEVPARSLSPYVQVYAGLVGNLIANKGMVKLQRMEFSPVALGYGVQAGINYMIDKNLGVGGGFSYSMSSYTLKTMPTAVMAFGGSYHHWRSTVSQYLFHLNFVYRHYWKPNYKHIEYVPSFYAGFNQFFVFGYGEHYEYGSELNEMYTHYSKHDNFLPSFTCGMSNTLLFHPFPKNTGLKFGITSYFDFIPLPAMSYRSIFSNNNSAEYEEREVSIKPHLLKWHFTVAYTPVVKLKPKASRQK
ncbi:MAG: hypothetical protein KIS94_13600 [Chitinophagales bacterium]|nr:hypothetical protein [Chitinophagales bacterium]